MNAAVDVLLPSCARAGPLAMTLTALAMQTLRPLRIVISDQTEGLPAFVRPEAQAVLRLLQARGHSVEAHHHLPRRGMAEQRAFLLAQARAPACLYLDDDVLIEPGLIERLLATLHEHACGFAGSALHGLSYLDDERPHQQHIEFWHGRVTPETVTPGTAAWERHHLHSAANLFHVQRALGLPPGRTRAYRVAWVGGCVLFDTAKLRAAGGFDFWPLLPPDHCGEDVLAQLQVMARFGGCGIVPSGAYHMELPTTLPRRTHDAPRLLWHPQDVPQPPAGAPSHAAAGPP